MRASTRVVFNTGIQYGRMLITVGISLYSTRLILDALGAIDYGIYNLIAGIIALLSFLNTAMSITTQRYLSVGQGKNDIRYQQKVFVNSFWLHAGIGLFVVLIAELCGFFLFDGFLNIVPERLEVARWVYHFMVLSIFFTILNVPFYATLTAHENFLYPAVLMIMSALLNLGIALSLQHVEGDKLFIYSFLVVIPIFLTTFLQGIYCIKKYQECRSFHHYLFDWSLLKELLGFAGWNLIHALCTVGTVQGIAILLNLFFGTVVNAAYGIAKQVSGQINFFANSMLVSMNPQIMKAEGAGDRNQMLRLSMSASKWGFFLLAFVAIPCIFEMPAILHFWLKEVPEHTIDFCRLILIAVLANQLTVGLTTAAQAIGKLKVYTLVVCIIRILILPCAYVLLRLGSSSERVLGYYILFELLASIVRIYMLKIIGGLSIYEFVIKVLCKELLPTLLLLGFYLFIIHCFDGVFRFVYSIPLGILIFWVSVYCMGLQSEEKMFIMDVFKRLRIKLLR